MTTRSPHVNMTTRAHHEQGEDSLGGAFPPPPFAAGDAPSGWAGRGVWSCSERAPPMPFVQVGGSGSLTSACALVVLAIGIRVFSNAVSVRRAARSKGTPASRRAAVGFITREGLEMLDCLRCVPFVVVDVRDPDPDASGFINMQTQDSQQRMTVDRRGASAPCSEPATERARASSVGEAVMRSAVCIPEKDMNLAFNSEAGLLLWSKYRTSKPDRRQVIVFVSTGRGNPTRASRAAAAVASFGYSRCLVLKGGINAIMSMTPSVSVSGGGKTMAREISRDAVAAIFGAARGQGSSALARVRSRSVLIDVRRHDERALYGSIGGSVHLPVCQIPRACSIDPNEWQKTFRFPKPSDDDIIILHCRTSKRARWAFQLLSDGGWKNKKNMFVYPGGCFGWRLDDDVKVYDAYDEGEVPPEPHPVALEVADESKGMGELRTLGLLEC